MAGFNRRDFLNLAAATGAVAPLAAAAQAQAQSLAKSAAPATPNGDVAWIDGAAPAAHEGQTWGMPWPRGAHKKTATFALRDGGPMQSWPIAYWPDGSIKWTAHAVPANAALTEKVWISPGKSAAPAARISVRETASAIEITSGPLAWKLGRKGANIIASASVAGRETLRDVQLVALTQDQTDFDDKPVVHTRYVSDITAVTVEQTGPVRAVVKVDGTHRQGERGWLPFSLRLYFYAGSEAVQIMHSFIFDGDESKDYIRGLGLTGSVPFTDVSHDRHVRISGEGNGVFGEAVRTLTGLRRDPGAAYRAAQMAGKKTGPLEGMDRNVGVNLKYLPEWGDFTLSQPNADGFTIRKRTKAGHGWIDAIGGRRATGLAYIGGASGGVAFAMNNFWQRPPTRLDIREAHTDAAKFTVWLWSPDAPAMDIRFYHDGQGMDTYAKQNAGLDISYEDYEPGEWGRPVGIARTNEITLWVLPATPTNARFAQMAAGVQTPPRLIATPARLNLPGILGDWSVEDRSTPTRAKIEAQNDYHLKYYMDQVEQRRWYGFWSHGDVMHSADNDRRVWRYDVGGMAWANSELSPDLWLWYSFLRSGRADVFRLAEAMTRHTGEVDVCHIGPYRGFGTRHGVQHWGDSSKQPRVSNAANRRIYFYLTADERVGDLMHDLIDSDQTLQNVFIERKVAAGGSGDGIREKIAGTVDCSFGTSWSSFVAAWLTEWERTGDTKWRDRINNGMTSIAKLKYGWFNGGAPYDLATGKFVGAGDMLDFSHLNAVFGAVETHSEVFHVIDNPAYKAAWLDYCTYYNAPAEMLVAKFGRNLSGRNLGQAHSRLTAYAAAHTKDTALAERAWAEYFGEGDRLNAMSAHQKIAGPDVFAPVDWNPRLGTNNVSQWALASFQNLALAGDALEKVAANLPPPRARPGAAPARTPSPATPG